MSQFRPMLAPNQSVTPDQLIYPGFASAKLDGIRASMQGGIAVSRKLLPIPNPYVQARLAGLPDGLDGELIVGAKAGKGVFKRSYAVMREHGEPDFSFNVFDYAHDHALDFETRFQHAAMIADAFGHPVVDHELIQNAEAMQAFEDRCLAAGYEGAMFRSCDGPYKHGRATFNEGYLFKLKRFIDAEAEVIGYVEQNTNTNEATINELGYTKRSTKKAGKIANGLLGAWKCRLPSGVEFELGSAKGVTKLARLRMWETRETYLGRWAKFKYQELSADGVPRIPIFLGWRDPRDMD
jgi:DNA ligase-1